VRPRPKHRRAHSASSESQCTREGCDAQDAYDTPFDQYDTPVDGDTAAQRLEARVDRLEARMDRLEAAVDRLEAAFGRLDVRLDRLERTVRWWIMVQMVSSTAWMALMIYLMRGGR
jgi:hypothetical protein